MWQREALAMVEENIRVMRSQLDAMKPGSEFHASTVWCIADAQRFARKLRGEIEGRVHEAAYPRIVN